MTPDIVMSMKNTITITSKGQTTIPVAYRRKLGLAAHGGLLDVRFNEATGELVIAKPLNIDALSKKISGYVKPDIKPLTDVDGYYQQHRQGR